MPTPLRQFNNEVNALITQTPSLQTVVIGRLWSPDASLQRTVALVRQLVAMGKTVLLLGPLPEPGLDVPQVYALQQIKAGHALAQMVVPLAAQTGPLAMRQTLLTELAEPLRQGRVQLLDPLARLCDDQVCRLAQAGSEFSRHFAPVAERRAAFHSRCAGCIAGTAPAAVRPSPASPVSRPLPAATAGAAGCATQRWRWWPPAATRPMCPCGAQVAGQGPAGGQQQGHHNRRHPLFEGTRRVAG